MESFGRAPGFDPSMPNVARMYDYFLGGKDNFAADRDAAREALEVAPELRIGARENRKFLRRAVSLLTELGVRQFIDIGCGLPTQSNVHEVAQSRAPGARVAYVDNDPVVIVHARAVLGKNHLTTAVQADLREPDQILEHPQLLELIDLRRPVGVLMFAVLHVIAEYDLADQSVKRLRDAVVPGSYLAISHAVSDVRPEVTAKLAALYQDKGAVTGPRRQNLRTKAEVERFFDGWELVEPGVVHLPEWRPDPAEVTASPAVVWSVGGVARKS